MPVSVSKNPLPEISAFFSVPSVVTELLKGALYEIHYD